MSLMVSSSSFPELLVSFTGESRSLAAPRRLCLTKVVQIRQ